MPSNAKIFINAATFIICFSYISLFAEKSRTSQLINQSISKYYNIHDKSLSIDLNSNVRDNSIFKNINISPGIIFTHNFSLNTNLSQYSDSINCIFRFINQRLEYKKNDSTDVLQRMFPLIFKFNNHLSKYIKSSPLFFGSDNSSEIRTSYNITENYSSDINPESLSDYLKDIIAGDWKKSKEFSLEYKLCFSPKLGIGRINDKSRTVKTLIIEDILLKRNVIKFPLSNKSIEELSSLIGEFTDKELRKKANLEKLRNKINIIVSSDASADKEMLRYISPLDLRKILLIRYHGLNSGSNLSINTSSILSNSLLSKDTKYPYDVFNKYNSFSSNRVKSKYRQDLLLKSSINGNINKYLFINLLGQRTLLSTDITPDFKNSSEDIKWINVLDTRWSFRANILLFPNFHVASGFDNLRTYLIIPNNPPENIFTSLHLFIEDYLEIRTILSYKFDIKDDPYLYLYNNQKTDFSEYRKLVFTLLLCYNF